MCRAVLFFPVGAVLRLGMLRQRFFRLAKAGGDAAQCAIRTDAVAVARTSGLTDSDSAFMGCSAVQHVAVFIHGFLRRNG